MRNKQSIERYRFPKNQFFDLRFSKRPTASVGINLKELSLFMIYIRILKTEWTFFYIIGKNCLDTIRRFRNFSELVSSHFTKSTHQRWSTSFWVCLRNNLSFCLGSLFQLKDKSDRNLEHFKRLWIIKNQSLHLNGSSFDPPAWAPG